MAKQLHFPEFDRLKIKDFGGALIKGNAREQRPLSTKRPLHLVMRSSIAKGERSFLHLKRSKKIRDIVYGAGKSQGVKVYRFANSGNHLHLVVLPSSRDAYFRFIRSITGRVARLTLNVERGRAKGLKFWDALPFTRILEWGKDFSRVSRYLRQNVLEALGFIPYQSRKKTRPPE